MTLSLLTERHWTCPNCDLQEVTREAAPHSRFHRCRGLAGLTAPMVPAGTSCKVVAVERQDYIRGDLVTVNGDRRPIMAVETTRDDGTDRAVFAPCAVAGRKDT